jgi:hypothetical protein
MNQNIYSILTTWVFPGLVPFISVYVGFVITKKHNDKAISNNQRVQRIKLLTLLKKEAEMYKSYRLQNNGHRSKEFISTNLVINSPVFNVEEHSSLIELALEMERLNQNIEIALNSSTGLQSTIMGGYLSNLSTGNPLMALSNSRLFKFMSGKTHAEKVAEGLQKMVNKTIEEATKQSLPLIEDIILETDRLLIIEKEKPKKWFNKK